MSDGIKVKIFPVLDERAFDELLKDINSRLQGAIPGSSTDSSSTASQSQFRTSSYRTNTNSDEDNETQIENTRRGIRQGLKDSAELDEEANEKRNKGLSSRLSTFFDSFNTQSVAQQGISKSIMSGVTAVAPEITIAITVINAILDVTFGIFDKIKSSSKALGTVMDLISNAFNLILMPIGNIMAMELMPTLSKLYQRLGDWMGKAMDIYEKDGWSGLIKEALITFGDMLVIFLGEAFINVIGPVLGEWIWSVFKYTTVGILLSQFFGDFEEYANFLGSTAESIWHKVEDVWQGLVDFFSPALAFFSTLTWDNLLPRLSATILDIFQNILNLDIVKTISEAFNTFLGNIKDFFKGVANLDIGKSIQGWWNGLDWTGWFKSLGDMLIGIFSGILDIGNSVTGGVKDWFNSWSPVKWNATGGVAVKQTIAGVGDEGTEAILPLDYLNSMLEDRTAETMELMMPTVTQVISNEMSSPSYNSSVSNSIGGTYYITNTINVQTDDAEKVGKEMKKMLDKSTGKVLTLM